MFNLPDLKWLAWFAIIGYIVTWISGIALFAWIISLILGHVRWVS